MSEASAILNQLKRQEQSLKAYAGHGRLKFKSPQRSFVANVSLAAIIPDRFWLSVTDFFGRSVLTLSVNQGRFNLLDHQEAKLFSGRASRKNLDYLLSTGLELKELLDLFAGGYFISSPERLELTRSDDGFIQLKLFEAGSLMVQRIYLTPLDMRVVRIERSLMGEDPFLVVNYSNYQRLNGRDVPFRVEMATRGSFTELTLNYKGFELNPGLDTDMFTLKIPPEIEVVHVGS